MRGLWQTAGPQTLLVVSLILIPGSPLSGGAGQQHPAWSTPPAPPAGLWNAELSGEGRNRLSGLSVTTFGGSRGDHSVLVFQGGLTSGGVECTFADIELPWPSPPADHLSFDCKTLSQHKWALNGGHVDLTFRRENREVTVVWRRDGASTTLVLHRPSRKGTSRYLGDWVWGPSPAPCVLHVYDNPEPRASTDPKESWEEFDKDHLIASFDDPGHDIYGRPVTLVYGSKRDPDAFTFEYFGMGHDLSYDGRYPAKTQEINGTAPQSFTFRRSSVQ